MFQFTVTVKLLPIDSLWTNVLVTDPSSYHILTVRAAPNVPKLYMNLTTKGKKVQNSFKMQDIEIRVRQNMIKQLIANNN